jgi:non-specific serine/threonine protein kinase/serine/threonine-protein kinase
MADETVVPGQPPSEETVVGPGSGGGSAGSGGRGSGGSGGSAGGGGAGGDRPGDRIGPFILLSVLGEGGFGFVWLAERREPYVQQVALKLIKAGMDSAAVIARFEQERQALAVMNHPNIAKVLDGGVTPNGRPYFAMEYVKGKPLNAYADERQLGIRDRLELFLQVCEAVQHAHTKGIIHRDLKPSNVLVHQGSDDRPQAKVIDFGIAKALTQRLTEREIFTMTGEMIGTPEYMSPEQAEPGALDVDTRTDVYSLGVMLYELLTGALPFDPRELRSRAYREIQRIIREVDPPTPSGRLSTIATSDSERATIIARARQERVDQLASTLRRELEWIPMKAMRKERQERYLSPNDLAQDIRNYLAGMPLVAAPESAAYRVRKFVRRNRVAVATAAAFAALLAAATVVSTLFGISESRARDRAERRERNLQQVLDFQHDQLATVGQEEAGLAMFGEIARQFENRLELDGMPKEARDAAVAGFRRTMRGVNPTDVAFQLIERVILKRGVGRADAEHAAEPLVQAGLLGAIGRTYADLGRPDRALDLFARAAVLLDREFGPDDRRTLTAREWIARSTPDAEAAVAEAERLLADRRRALGPEDEDTVESMRVLAGALGGAGRRADAARTWGEVVAIGDRVRADARVMARDLAAHGDALREGGDLDAAVAECLRAKAVLDAAPAPAARLRAFVLNNLALALTAKVGSETVPAGLDALREVVAIEDAANGERHGDTFVGRSNLAGRLMAQSAADRARRDEALDVLRRAVTIGRSLDFAPSEYYQSLHTLAVFEKEEAMAGPEEARRARLEAALALEVEAFETLRSRLGADADVVMAIEASLASFRQSLGAHAEAERILRGLAPRRTAADGSGSKDVLMLRADLARALASQGRWGDAIAELRGAAADGAAALPEDSFARWKVAELLLAYLELRSQAEPGSVTEAELGRERAAVRARREARAAAGRTIDLPPGDLAVP